MEQHSFGNATECSECGDRFTVLYGPMRICLECLNKRSEIATDEASEDAGEESPDSLELDNEQVEEKLSATLSWAESLAKDVGVED